MKHLNDFTFGDMEYSTYLELHGEDDGYICDIKNASGELVEGRTGFRCEVEAVDWAEAFLLEHYT